MSTAGVASSLETLSKIQATSRESSKFRTGKKVQKNMLHYVIDMNKLFVDTKDLAVCELILDTYTFYVNYAEARDSINREIAVEERWIPADEHGPDKMVELRYAKMKLIEQGLEMVQNAIDDAE